MPASTASAARSSRPRASSSTASARSTTPWPSGSRRRTTSSGSRATRTSCSRCTRSAPTSCSRAFRFNEVKSFVAGGLRDFSISRAGQPWGIPLPWDESQVAYVWADALVNYLSALTYARPGEDLRDEFWPEVRHLMAQDILRFHCVYWPAMLLSAGLHGAEADLHPRLPAARRAEDLEVARERDRSAGADRHLRRRRRALLVCARGAVRAGRQRISRAGSPTATSASSVTTSATCSRARPR